MRRTVIIVPDLVGTPESESVLRQNLPALKALAEVGNVFKLDPLPPIATPEALFLGMSEKEAQMAQGPLTVAALGADPPDPSTHFHLSLLTLEDAKVSKPTYFPTAEEEQVIWETVQRLHTKTLTLLQGERLDHALVWEGRGEFETHSPEDQPLELRSHLPQGDAEHQLRRLIDDSVNLLDPLELNQRRIDEGQSPFNILWPWGHGTRVPVPNLALRRGEPATIESASMRLQGLSRLAGYSHVDRASVGAGLKTRFSDIAKRVLSRDLSIVVLNGPTEMRALNRLEELEWYARELARELISPLLQDARTNESRLSLLCPSKQTSLGLSTTRTSDRPLPFDERTLEEKGVPISRIDEAIRNQVSQ